MVQPLSSYSGVQKVCKSVQDNKKVLYVKINHWFCGGFGTLQKSEKRYVPVAF